MNFREPRRLTRRLTPLNAQFTSVAFSPDGTRIAIAVVKRRCCAVFVMNTDGSHPRLVAGNENAVDDSYWYLQFTPDGKSIVACVSEEDGEFSDLVLIDIESRQQTRLTSSRHAGRPSLSPDGSSLVFESLQHKGMELFRIGTTGGETLRLTHDREERYDESSPSDLLSNHRPAYSPNGDWIAFTSTIDDKAHSLAQIHIMRPNGSERKCLTDLPEGVSSTLLWHSDGDRIAFTINNLNATYPMPVPEPAFPNLYLVSTNNAKIYKVPQSDKVGHSPSFCSPEGRSLAYSTFVGTRIPDGKRLWNIRIVDIETGHAFLVTQGDTFDVDPLFSPDGKSLVFVSNRANPTGETRFGMLDLYAIEIE